MSRTWVQRLYIKDPETGKTIRTRESGLGVYPSVSLAEAREIAKANQSLADQGVDPFDDEPEAEELEEQDSVPTFGKVAEEVYAGRL